MFLTTKLIVNIGNLWEALSAIGTIAAAILSLFIAIYGWNKLNVERRENDERERTLKDKIRYENLRSESINTVNQLNDLVFDTLQKITLYNLLIDAQKQSEPGYLKRKETESVINNNIKILTNQISNFTYGELVKFHNIYHLNQGVDFSNKEREFLDDYSFYFAVSQGISLEGGTLINKLEEFSEKLLEFRMKLVDLDYKDKKNTYNRKNSKNDTTSSNFVKVLFISGILVIASLIISFSFKLTTVLTFLLIILALLFSLVLALAYFYTDNKL